MKDGPRLQNSPVLLPQLFLAQLHIACSIGNRADDLCCPFEPMDLDRVVNEPSKARRVVRNSRHVLQCQ